MTLTKKQLNNFWRKVEKTDTCWNWKGASCKGYGRFGLNGQNCWAHKISLIISGVNIKPQKKELAAKGIVIMHTCDNPACVNPQHLKVATQKENIADAIAKGRKCYGETRGEGNPKAKLTWKDVDLIRSSNMSLEEFKKKYNFISSTRLHSIKNFNSWIPA